MRTSWEQQQKALALTFYRNCQQRLRWEHPGSNSKTPWHLQPIEIASRLWSESPGQHQKILALTGYKNFIWFRIMIHHDNTVFHIHPSSSIQFFTFPIKSRHFLPLCPIILENPLLCCSVNVQMWSLHAAPIVHSFCLHMHREYMTYILEMDYSKIHSFWSLL